MSRRAPATPVHTCWRNGSRTVWEQDRLSSTGEPSVLHRTDDLREDTAPGRYGKTVLRVWFSLKTERLVLHTCFNVLFNDTWCVRMRVCARACVRACVCVCVCVCACVCVKTMRHGGLPKSCLSIDLYHIPVFKCCYKMCLAVLLEPIVNINLCSFCKQKKIKKSRTSHFQLGMRSCGSLPAGGCNVIMSRQTPGTTR